MSGQPALAIRPRSEVLLQSLAPGFHLGTGIDVLEKAHEQGDFPAASPSEQHMIRNAASLVIAEFPQRGFLDIVEGYDRPAGPKAMTLLNDHLP